MAKNVKQVYDANPSTSLTSTALIYLGLSPFGASSDSAILVSDFYNTTNLQLSSGKLNTIQNITTASSPTFAGLTLTAFSGVVIAAAGVLSSSATLSGALGGTGVANTGLTVTLASGGTGKVLVSDVSGNATYSALAGIAVTSATGTSNQVLINGDTSTHVGALTFTLPQSIGTGSSPTFAGLTLTAFSGVVTATAGVLGSSATLSGALGGTGTANTGLTINLASGATGKILVSDVSGNATYSALSGLAITNLAGTANQINTSASTGSATLTLSSTLVTPGTLAVNGSLAASSSTTLNATSAYNTVITGTQTAQTSGTQFCLYLTPTLAPSAQLSGYAASIQNSPTITVPNVTNPAIGNAYGYYSLVAVNGTAGKSINNVASIYIDAMTLSTATVDNAYGIYCKTPAGGTKTVALYSDTVAHLITTSSSTSLTLGMTHCIVNLSSTSARAITLPNANTMPTGFLWTVKDSGGAASTGNITITPTTSTIDGAASLIIASNYGSVDIYNDGTNYFIK